MAVVPALPDTERISSHTISGAGPYNVGFDVYGNSTDYAQWLEVYDDGVKLTAVTDWTLDSPTGSLATLQRPITDARVTLVSASRSGTLKIVGADRPRRATQLTEGVGVSARDFNQAITQIIARLREAWDVLRTRTLIGRPGEAVDMMLPAIADRQGKALTFDSDGKPTATTLTGALTVVDNNSITDAMLADMGACSVKGRSANSSGDPADISASANGQMLARLSNAVAWSTLSAYLDSVLGSTRGMIIRREAASWAAYALGASGYVLTSDGTDAAWAAASSNVPRGYIDGLILSNNAGDATNDIDIAAGTCRDSTNTVTLVGTALTKRLDADWVAGTNQGGRYSGAAIANSPYHVFIIGTAALATDYFFYTGTDPTAVLPATYVYFRRIGSIVRSGGAILGFTQHGDEFLLKVPLNSISTTNPGTSAVTFAVTGVPSGVKMRAILSGYVNFATTGAGAYVWVFSTEQTDAAPDAVFHTVRTSSGDDTWAAVVRTNTSAQVKYRLSASGASDAVQINCNGWHDLRGKDA